MYGHTIGVNYRGGGAYKTRIGAFVTFVTYFLMFWNLTSLIEVFLDGLEQEEKGYSIKIDRFKEGYVNLAEHDL